MEIQDLKLVKENKMRYFLFIYEYQNKIAKGGLSFGIASENFPSKEYAKDRAYEILNWPMIERHDLSIKNIIEFNCEKDYNSYFDKP